MKLELSSLEARMERENKNTIEILEDLISLRSDVDDTGRNEGAVIDYIVDFFSKLKGWEIEKQEVLPGRYNIVATSSLSPELVWIGHMDTVPVVSESQLQARTVDGKIYGRGSVDMKAGLALMLWLAQEKAWKKTAFVFTVGEEYDFCGMEKFMQAYSNWCPGIVINPEPTNLRLSTQCRGVCEWKMTFKGKTAHAAKKEQGINAIEKSALFVSLLEERLSSYDSPSMKTTLNFAAIQGGVEQNGELITRPNMVADTAYATLEARLASNKITKEVLENLANEVATQCDIGISSFEYAFLLPPMLESTGEQVDVFKGEVEQAGIALVQDNPSSSGYFEVALAQQAWNCPVILFGPGPVRQAHKEDEYVSIESMEKAQAVFLSYMEKYRNNEVQ